MISPSNLPKRLYKRPAKGDVVTAKQLPLNGKTTTGEVTAVHNGLIMVNGRWHVADEAVIHTGLLAEALLAPSTPSHG